MLETPIEALPRTSPLTIKRLKNLGIHTYAQLLMHIPHRYEDRSIVATVRSLQVGEKVVIRGRVVSTKSSMTRTHKQIQQVIVADETGQITLSWFNQPYILQMLRADMQIMVWGECKLFGRERTFIPLEYEVVGDKPSVHMGRMIPIYHETYGLSSKTIREKIAGLLFDQLSSEHLRELDPLPAPIFAAHALVETPQALREIHFPQSNAMLLAAKKRLSFDELFVVQLSAMIIRRLWQRESLSHQFEIESHQKAVEAFVARLPYPLTGAQIKAYKQIYENLRDKHPMNRFLQGDVGSGKTVVAALAAYIAQLNGYQTLVMAPTEILAKQHYQSFVEFFEKHNVAVALQTRTHKQIKAQSRKADEQTENLPRAKAGRKPASRKGGQKTCLAQRRAENSPSFDVIVGTHALLNEALDFGRVGLVIIDEQHRFGVRQRSALRAKGIHPHLLSMTATPIPRTVALTVFGELEMSVLDEMPAGRLRVKSYLVPAEKRQAGYEWIKQHLDKGQQAYIICPFVQESEHETAQSVKAATVEYERLKKEVFGSYSIGLLHGKMKTNEKDQVMREFKDRTHQVLVATSVVEVGVDVPNATIILIEGAERFGLAQLHQLRGRVGRGSEQSHCLLFTSDGVWSKNERLAYFAAHPLGIDIAEFDLKTRGTGDIYGTRQHGVGELKIASLADTTLIATTREAAQSFVTSFDPNKHPILAMRLEDFHVSEIAKD